MYTNLFMKELLKIVKILPLHYGSNNQEKNRKMIYKLDKVNAEYSKKNSLNVLPKIFQPIFITQLYFSLTALSLVSMKFQWSK